MKINGILAGVSLAVLTMASAQSRYRDLQIDASAVTGTIRSYQGVDGGPAPLLPGAPDLSKRYREVHVDLVRTHDLYGPGELDSHFDDKFFVRLIQAPAGRAAFVRQANQSVIFPNPHANPDDAASYNFTATDRVIAAIRGAGAEVYFHVGRSFGAAGVDASPVDEAKYAVVLRHVVLHYNKGWAGGMRSAVKYWAIWTEPEFPEFWSKKPEDLFAFYDTLARAIKGADATALVGGIGKAFAYEPGPYREGFLDFVVRQKSPLDFYSWNWFASYSGDAWDPVIISREIRQLLDARGLQKAGNYLAEWNISTDKSPAVLPIHESMLNAAFTGAVLTYLQDSPTDKAMLYRGDSLPSGLFHPDGEPLKKFHAFKAAAEMLQTPRRLGVSGADNIGFAVLAGSSNDGRTVQVLISNYEFPKELKPLHPTPPLNFKRVPVRHVQYKDNQGYNLRITQLPWGKGAYTVTRRRLDQAHDFSEIETRTGSGGNAEISSELPPPAVELITIRKK